MTSNFNEQSGINCCLSCGLLLSSRNLRAVRVLKDNHYSLEEVAESSINWSEKLNLLATCFSNNEWKHVRALATNYRGVIPIILDRLGQAATIPFNWDEGFKVTGRLEIGNHLEMIAEVGQEEVITRMMVFAGMEAIKVNFLYPKNHPVLTVMDCAVHFDLERFRFTTRYHWNGYCRYSTHSFNYPGTINFAKTRIHIKKSLMEAFEESTLSRIRVISVKNILVSQSKIGDEDFATPNDWLTFFDRVITGFASRSSVILGIILPSADDQRFSVEHHINLSSVEGLNHDMKRGNVKILRIFPEASSLIHDLSVYRNE